MKLHLEEVTRDNWHECIRLKVTPNQARYVPNNLYSLAESKFITDRIPLAIYDDESMVGLVVCSYNDQLGRGWVHRLVIGEGFENRGYSTNTMQLLIRRFRRIPGCSHIGVDFRPENSIIDDFYRSYGFRPTGQRTAEGDIICVLRFSSSRADNKPHRDQLQADTPRSAMAPESELLGDDSGMGLSVDPSEDSAVDPKVDTPTNQPSLA